MGSVEAVDAALDGVARARRTLRRFVVDCHCWWSLDLGRKSFPTSFRWLGVCQYPYR